MGDSKARRDYVVEYPYTARNYDEITLQIGEMVTDVEKHVGGWWRGRVRGEVGLFPETHVKELRLSDIIFQSDKTCRVVFAYEPVHQDELRLKIGDEVQVIEEVELGWWRGRLGERVGVFPASHISVSEEAVEVKSTEHNQVLACPRLKSLLPDLVEDRSPVQLRRNSSRARGAYLSLEQSSGARPTVSSSLFDPEDEPLEPLYGTTLADFTTTDIRPTGVFHKLRNSLGGKTKLPKFIRRRLTSGSFLETQSTCSPVIGRRNSVAAFFRRGSSCSVQTVDEDRPGIFCRLSRSWDTAFQSSKSKCSSSPEVQQLEKDFGKLNCLPVSLRTSSTRDTEQSTSWVWEEESSRGHMELDSGYVDCNLTNTEEEGEVVFGPVDKVTDEVFQDMFPPVDMLASSTPVSGQRQRSKVRTSTGRFTVLEEGGTRSKVVTNPFVSWKPLERSQVTDI